MEQALPLNPDIGELLRRRLPAGLLTAAILLVVALALALGLPPVYKSRAVILIEAQEIPQDLVRSLVTSYADQRIQVISQRVLTNANLTRIIEKYELYLDERASDPLEVVLEQMREDITVEPISADVVDQKSGKASKATIAVELAYENKSPGTAQRVANELVSLYLNENLKQRAETTDETLSFLNQESEKLRTEVADLETRLATFKEGNAGQLPELTSLNIQWMNKAEQDLVQVENQIRSLQQQGVYLESEIAQQQPTTQLLSETGQRILGPADRLKVLESEFIPLAARYGEKHPDVVAMRKEIDSLRAQVGGASAGSEIALQLKQKQNELTAARERYAPDHPDLKRLNREVESLQGELARANAAGGVYTPPPGETPDNPAYIQLQARLEATKADMGSLRAQAAALKAKIADFEQRLTNAPQVEREYRVLTRDYEAALAKYQEVLAKSREARLSQSLESGQKGERFTLIEPPVIPEEPDKPNRLAIGFLGLVLSAIGGVGVGAVAEGLDNRVYGRSGVTRVLGVPPLAVIPNIENPATRRLRLRKRLLAAVVAAAVLALAALAIHLLYRPLDVLFFQVLRALGL